MAAAPGSIARQEEDQAVAVVMLPDHYRAYCEWLSEHKLKTGPLPFSGLDPDVPIYIVTPAYNHPRGKRA